MGVRGGGVRISLNGMTAPHASFVIFVLVGVGFGVVVVMAVVVGV